MSRFYELFVIFPISQITITSCPIQSHQPSYDIF